MCSVFIRFCPNPDWSSYSTLLPSLLLNMTLIKHRGTLLPSLLFCWTWPWSNIVALSCLPFYSVEHDPDQTSWHSPAFPSILLNMTLIKHRGTLLPSLLFCWTWPWSNIVALSCLPFYSVEHDSDQTSRHFVSHYECSAFSCTPLNLVWRSSTDIYHSPVHVSSGYCVLQLFYFSSFRLPGIMATCDAVAVRFKKTQ